MRPFNLVEYIDAFWPYAAGEKPFDNEKDTAEMEAFFDAWATRNGQVAE